MLEEINGHLCSYSDILKNMITLVAYIEDSSELAGLLEVTQNDMKRLIIRIENSLK